MLMSGKINKKQIKFNMKIKQLFLVLLNKLLLLDNRRLSMHVSYFLKSVWQDSVVIYISDRGQFASRKNNAILRKFLHSEHRNYISHHYTEKYNSSPDVYLD